MLQFLLNTCYNPHHQATNNQNKHLITTISNGGDDINRKGCNNTTALGR